MEDKKLKGAALDIIGNHFDIHMRACKKVVAENPELVILFDMESGYPYVGTKEQRDTIDAMWEHCKPKIPADPKLMGKFFLFGTGGKMDKHESEFDYGFSDLE